MQRRYKALILAAGLLLIAATALGITMSHNSPCASTTPPPLSGQQMRAVVYRCYGSPAVLKIETIAKPLPDDNRVLVKVHAASVNPLDWHYLRGEPYFMRAESGVGIPHNIHIGVDFAGIIESVGKNVSHFKPGDEVFGGRTGAFGDYVSVAETGALAIKPPRISFEQAAAVPIAAITALQAVRDRGQVKAGQKVVINGASGGVGTFAVQLAKVFGATVTGICSAKNADMVRSIGADQIVDYAREDFTLGAQRYDVIIDTVGTHSVWEYRRVMNPHGILVIVGSLDKGHWLGPLWSTLKAYLVAPFVSQTVVMLFAELNPADLNLLRDLIQAGKVTPVIDKIYALREVAAAFSYLEQGHTRGKVVITITQ